MVPAYHLDSLLYGNEAGRNSWIGPKASQSQEAHDYPVSRRHEGIHWKRVPIHLDLVPILEEAQKVTCLGTDKVFVLKDGPSIRPLGLEAFKNCWPRACEALEGKKLLNSLSRGSMTYGILGRRMPDGQAWTRRSEKLFLDTLSEASQWSRGMEGLAIRSF